jgi:hypothetical protein
LAQQDGQAGQQAVWQQEAFGAASALIALDDTKASVAKVKATQREFTIFTVDVLLK